MIYLTPSQIKSFGKSYIIPLNYKNIKTKEGFIVFLTNSQINKLEKAMANKKKVDLKFSKTQFKKTLNKVIKLNYDFRMKENRKKLANLRVENQKKRDKIEALKLKLLTKKQGKVNLISFIKNTVKKYKEPKPKKKSIWDVIELPKANLI